MMKTLSLEAAINWSRWEAATSKLVQNNSLIDEFSDPYFALAFALIENHYFINKGFLNSEDQLIKGIEKIRHIPAKLYKEDMTLYVLWKQHMRSTKNGQKQHLR